MAFYMEPEKLKQQLFEDIDVLQNSTDPAKREHAAQHLKYFLQEVLS